MNFIKEFLRKRSEKKKIKARQNEIEMICLRVRQFSRAHEFDTVQSIIGMMIYNWDFDVNGKKYRIVNESMVRGELFSLIEFNDTQHESTKLVEFGDQSRAYSFLGLCRDLYCVDSFTLEKLEQIVKD